MLLVSEKFTSFRCQFVSIEKFFDFVLVPSTGLEPVQLTLHAPKACVSANSTTRACKHYTTGYDVCEVYSLFYYKNKR